MKSRILNFSIYQIGWFACVLGAAHGDTVWLIIAALCVAFHLVLAQPFKKQMLIVLVGALVGTIVEMLLIVFSVYRFPTPGISPGLPPVWIVVMWMQFAALLPYCLAWLSRRYILAAVLGLVGGPLAFLGGERLGGVEFLAPRAVHLAALGCLWSGALPLLVWAVDRILATPRQPSSYRGLGD